MGINLAFKWLIYFVRLLQATVVIYLNNFKGFDFKIEEGCVLYEVQNEEHTAHYFFA
jgi:hypothetical protein